MAEEATDVMEVLAQTAKRQHDEKMLAERMSKARRKLLFRRGKADYAFWATLTMRLKVEVGWDLPTMATDGKRLRCNPEFVATLSDEELIGVVAHEVAHNALMHHTRMQNRNPERWNIAADLAINPLIVESGLTLPASRLMPGEGIYAKIAVGQSAEAIYNQLPNDPGKGKGKGKGDGKGQGQGDGEPDQGNDPGGCGGVEKPGDGSEAAARESESEWEVNVSQAHHAAKQRGTLSAGIDRLVQEMLNPKVDWRDVLRDFIQKTAKNDYRWTPPNRRFAWRKMYLPSITGETIGDIVVAVDTSGSVGAAELSRFSSEINGIVGAYEDACLTILYHDSEVCHVQRWTPSEGPLVLEPKGGGGTDHRPVFDWVSNEGMEPACMVALTDLMSMFPDKAPDYPVLWASVSPRNKGPFGVTVDIS